MEMTGILVRSSGQYLSDSVTLTMNSQRTHCQCNQITEKFTESLMKSLSLSQNHRIAQYFMEMRGTLVRSSGQYLIDSVTLTMNSQ